MKTNTLLALLLGAALCLLLGGCQDYHGLDELTIVAGMAIDVDEEDPGLLAVSFEVIDLQNISDGETPATKLVQTTGLSLSEAVYKASAKLHNNMYFGNCEMVVISRQIAESRGLDSLIDALLRDNETRDNLHILISGGETAREIIATESDSNMILSFNLNLNVDQEEHPANATRAMELYQVYDRRALGTTNLMLPVIVKAQEDESELLLDGMAVFTEDKLTAYMGQDFMPYYLLGVSRIRGGGYTIPVEEDGQSKYVAISVRRSTPKHRVSYDGEKFIFTVSIDMVTSATEFSSGWDDVGYDTIRRLEQHVAAYLEEQLWNLADVYRQEGYDILELGDCVRNYEPRLWEQVAEEWDDWLADAEIQIDCKVKIDHTGLIEEY